MVCTVFPGKTREKGIHHRSGQKGIHHRASDPEKEKRRVSTVVVYTFFFPVRPLGDLRDMSDSDNWSLKKRQGRADVSQDPGGGGSCNILSKSPQQETSIT